MAKGKSKADQLGLFGESPEAERAPRAAPAPRDGERPELGEVKTPPAKAPKPSNEPPPNEPPRNQPPCDEPPPIEPPQRKPDVLTVARLDHLIRRVVEGATTNVLVQGEVSGLHRAGSGHCYFSLKDQREDALIDCVMYRTAPIKARRALRDGECVVISGRVTLYAPRGRLQLIADNVLQTERGALLEALEKLKKKLAAEGLFAPENKKPLPTDPQRIAVLTSRTGAAIHDVIRVAARRGRVHLLLVPTPVQGFGAAERIARAIAFTDRIGVDAIIVTRGGGSAEDLAAYNDEAVVRAIAACRTPVLSAVGHEIDVSLADLAADARAATPSQAAEILVPDARERQTTLDHLRMRLGRAMRHRLIAGREKTARLWAAIEEPRRLLLERRQLFDELSARMERAVTRQLAGRKSLVESASRRLQAQHPRRVTAEARQTLGRLEPRLAASLRERLVRERRRIAELEPRLPAAQRERLAGERRRIAQLEPRTIAAIKAALSDAHRRLGRAAAQLDAMSPLAVLSRGYAIATTPDGHVLMRASETQAGDPIHVRLHEGTVTAVVDATQEPEDV